MNINKKRIKTDLTAIALILAVAITLLVVGYRFGEMNSQTPTTTYTMNGVWTPDGNTIATEDGRKHHYLCTEDGYMLRCVVTFDNNGTPNDKTDDEIIDVIVKG